MHCRDGTLAELGSLIDAQKTQSVSNCFGIDIHNNRNTTTFLFISMRKQLMTWDREKTALVVMSSIPEQKGVFSLWNLIP